MEMYPAQIDPSLRFVAWDDDLCSDRHSAGYVNRGARKRDPSVRFDCVGRRKLDFFNAAKLLLLGHVRGEEVTFAGGQDDHPWSFQIGIAVRRRASGESAGRIAFEHKHDVLYTISKQ
jgi:hypothetical protein